MVKLTYEVYDQDLMDKELGDMTVAELDRAFHKVMEGVKDESTPYLGHQDFAEQVYTDLENLIQEMENRLAKMTRR